MVLLITIIRGLVMHGMTGLINSESSQRHFLFNLNLNHRIWTNRFLVWTSNSYPWIGLDTRCNQQPLFQISSRFKVPRRNYIKFCRILNLGASRIFNLKSIPNLNKFLWRKLFISLRPSKPYLFPFSKTRKVLFQSTKVWSSLRFVWNIWIRNLFQILFE